MTKRLFWLNGIAILSVLINHAIGWGFTAMFWWTDRYRPVSVPNFDAIGSPVYTIMVLVKQLTPFSVPVFLVVSGYFIAFASRAGLNWKMLFSRLKSLLIPYLIWSIVIMILDIILGEPFNPLDIVPNLILGNAVSVFYYVPLICQLYMLSPFLVPLIRSSHWKKVLAAAGVMQAIMLSSNYLSIFAGYTIDVDWFFGNLVFFFVFGIVLHFHYDEIKAWVHRTRIFWLAALAVCTVLAIVETEVYFRLGLGDWRGGVETAAASLYIICFLMLFIEFDKIEFRYSNWLGKIGQKSYGIYLTHPITLLLASKLIYHIAPAVLAWQWFFTPLLILLGAAVPLLMMRIVSQTPLRKGYRYLFG